VQFGIIFANTGHGASPDGAKAVVQAAETGGFTTAWTVEHVVVPSGTSPSTRTTRAARWPAAPRSSTCPTR
jgi:alkanesulfonate monooxygenase SsuD/methylene tetrahydromethanopterin reductase-like flavin-dependent oxidoreductase (luciferase family)